MTSLMLEHGEPFRCDEPVERSGIPGEFNGRRLQTVVTRCKVVEQPEAAAA